MKLNKIWYALKHFLLDMFWAGLITVGVIGFLYFFIWFGFRHPAFLLCICVGLAVLYTAYILISLWDHFKAYYDEEDQ